MPWTLQQRATKVLIYVGGRGGRSSHSTPFLHKNACHHQYCHSLAKGLLTTCFVILLMVLQVLYNRVCSPTQNL